MIFAAGILFTDDGRIIFMMYARLLMISIIGAWHTCVKQKIVKLL